ncbi:MAG TPA: DUF134 domain-containing protein [Bacteroidetes bacterium]|nr:DUF134 domain-containing protein [Bacteroidota bacterium]
MSRPPIRRQVSVRPAAMVFKPVGLPYHRLEELELTLDELEALRLAHMQGFYQEAISRRMGVSRQTAARILDRAHRKMTEALIEGKALRVVDGPVRRMPDDPDLCPRCGHHRGGEHRGRRWCGRCRNDVPVKG